jgi:SAM-dependent methyltransferase
VGEGIYSDGRYARSNPTYHVEDSLWKAQNLLRLIGRRQNQPRSIAEIGCGAGEALRCIGQALPAIERLEGWDISPDAIALAQGRADDRLAFHLGDLLSAGRSPFDLVLCFDVFEHVDDYLGFLRKLRAVGREFAFHIPLDLSAQSVIRVKPIIRARTRLGHLHYFTKETALATLESSGYVIDEWRYTAGSIDLPDKTIFQNLMRWPRRFGMRVAPDLAARTLGGFSLLVLAR